MRAGRQVLTISSCICKATESQTARAEGEKEREGVRERRPCWRSHLVAARVELE